MLPFIKCHSQTSLRKCQEFAFHIFPTIFMPGDIILQKGNYQCNENCWGRVGDAAMGEEIKIHPTKYRNCILSVLILHLITDQHIYFRGAQKVINLAKRKKTISFS
jgi:hypothetical protein